MHCKRRGSENSTSLAIFWGLLIFSGAPVLSKFHYKTSKFNRTTDFYKHPCNFTCLYNTPSLHTIEIAGWLRNRTGTGNRNRRNRFSRNRKRNRNRRNRLPRNRNRNRNRPFLLDCTETQKKKKNLLQWNRRNRKPEPLEPFHPQTVTEPNRTGASLKLSQNFLTVTIGNYFL